MSYKTELGNTYIRNLMRFSFGPNREVYERALKWGGYYEEMALTAVTSHAYEVGIWHPCSELCPKPSEDMKFIHYWLNKIWDILDDIAVRNRDRILNISKGEE